MRALTVLPGRANSAQLEEVPEPSLADGTMLVRALALGVCGTDREIISGRYGWAPPGAERLVLGHESFGEVLEAPADAGFKPGDRVVGIVRRPDPVPCVACAAGEWDMCRNGRYTERGIKERAGYCSERFRLEPAFAVKVDPALGDLGVLMEPTSIIAKAWDHIERIGHRSHSWRAHTLLVTGAGPVGLLAAMMGAQRGLDVHVLDLPTEGLKPELVGALGGTYHAGKIPDDLRPDIAIECTGAWRVVRMLLGCTGAGGIVCLAGVTAPGANTEIDIGALNRTLVLNNDAIFGSVNANHSHYQLAADSLTRADKKWLARLITRRVPLARWQEALESRPDDIKVVIDFTI